MTGYRLGYIAASVEIAKACEKLQGQFTSGTNAVTQRAAITALSSDLRPTQEMVKEFQRRRQRRDGTRVKYSRGKLRQS